MAGGLKRDARDANWQEARLARAEVGRSARLLVLVMRAYSSLLLNLGKIRCRFEFGEEVAETRQKKLTERLILSSVSASALHLSTVIKADQTVKKCTVLDDTA